MDSRKFEMSTVSEIRKELKDWTSTNLVGKQVFISAINKTIQFTKQGCKHDISRAYKDAVIELALIKKLPGLLTNATFICTDLPKRDDKNVKMIYKFYQMEIHEKRIYQIWLLIKETKEGIFYYDHGLIEKAPI
jgi:Large polyvalent protein-associated domain 3